MTSEIPATLWQSRLSMTTGASRDLGADFGHFFETDAKICSGMAVAACTPNLKMLLSGSMRDH